MAAEYDVDELADLRICSACIGDIYLSQVVERTGVADIECSYCDGTSKTISIGELADYVEEAFQQHYHRTSNEPEGIDYLLAKEGRWDRAGERSADAIANAAEIDGDAAEHVRQILYERHYDEEEARAGGEGDFDTDAQYEEGPVRDGELQAEWQYFQQSMQTQSRLFNRDAEATLASLFEDLAAHKTLDGRPAIVESGPEKELHGLYLARVFQSNDKLEKALERPDIELGPPPPRLAIAGRMNSRGIAVFYGATDADVALAETRPPVGSKVATALFEIVRPLRLLDIEVLRRIYVEGSIFDTTFLARLEKAKFLRTVSERITEPVMPDDEPFEYLVTQAIADYLAGQREPQIDGIIYPSVQDGGNKMNVVLFHKAARVEPLDIPPGTDISAHLFHYDEDGSSPDYTVYEEVPSTKKPPQNAVDDDFPFSFLPFPHGYSRDVDTRAPTLRIDITSVKVHHIQGVTYSEASHDVARHRHEKRDKTF